MTATAATTTRRTGRTTAPRTPDRARPSALGTVRKRPSGRYSASYRVDGRTYNAPRTFATKQEAQGWLATERADRLRGTWRDPHDGAVNLAAFLDDWLSSRAKHLAERTVNSYRITIDRWICARLVDAAGHAVELGALDLSQITPAVVRKWYAVMAAAATRAGLERVTYVPQGHPARLWAQDNGHDVADTGQVPAAIKDAWRAAGSPLPAPRRRPSMVNVDPGSATAARAYATLHAALADAVDDGLMDTNPCRLRGASTHTPQERGTCTPAEVVALAHAMPAHLSAAVIVAAWSALRYGELFALARRHVDLAAGTVRVERALSEGARKMNRTKTTGSVRTVHLPGFVVDVLRDHMATYTAAGPDALVFTTTQGRAVSTRTLSQIFNRARTAIGRPELHWHDLRHTGATLAYREGASVKDVQRRLGHTTSRAAMIYAHAADESDALIAQRLNDAWADHDNIVPIGTARTAQERTA
ncbi:MAG: tyrosine-type recombinase/integrase [Propionibacteriaceae bacterium]|nr:tyrosine-type recombinase/integrase [Propionibacteriaceae bacterium]